MAGRPASHATAPGIVGQDPSGDGEPRRAVMASCRICGLSPASCIVTTHRTHCPPSEIVVVVAEFDARPTAEVSKKGDFLDHAHRLVLEPGMFI